MTSGSAPFSASFPMPFRVSSAADILGYIPHALGFQPRESLVFLTLTGKSLGATLRLDLPRSADPLTNQEYAETVCRFLSADTGADSVLMVMYTEQPWVDPAAPPGRELTETLQRELELAGMPLRDAWLVSESRWREYLCDDVACCPWPGRDPELIRTSTLGTEMIFRGSSVAASPAEAVSLIETPAWTSQPELDAVYELHSSRPAAYWTQPERFGEVLREWDAYVSGWASEVESLRSRPDRAGYLLASLHCRPLRDALLVLAAVGCETALEGAAAHHLRQQMVTTTAPDGALRGEADAAAARFSRVLLGECDTPPDWHRLDAAFELFRQLVSAASGEARAALHTMMAWVEWLRGRGSRAQQYLDACLADVPDYRLALLLEGLLSSGHLSLWSRSAATAWREPRQDAA